MYEQWCKHSKEAIKEVHKMVKDPRFLDMEIPIGFFNLYKEHGFKKLKDIKKIPLIQLYINKTEVTYHGIIEKNKMLSWLMEKTKLVKLPHLKSLDEFKNILKTKGMAFFYFGDLSN